MSIYPKLEQVELGYELICKNPLTKSINTLKQLILMKNYLSEHIADFIFFVNYKPIIYKKGFYVK